MGAIKNMHKWTMKMEIELTLSVRCSVATIKPNRIFQLFNFMAISCLCIYALNFKIHFHATLFKAHSLSVKKMLSELV